MSVLEPIKCVSCAALFVPSKPKQVFCSTNCRVKAHQAKKKEEEKINAEEFKDLKSKPKHTVETARELNKDWVILDTNLSNILHDKHKLELQKEALILKSEKILKGNQGMIAGLSVAVIGGAIMLYGLVNSDDKNNEKNRTGQIVLGLLLTLAISGLAYVLATEYGKKVNEKDKRILIKVDTILEEAKEIESKINAIDIQSAIIKEELKLVPRYLKETKIETIIKP